MINGEKFEKSINHCHLGITFQSSVWWNTHTDIIYKKHALVYLYQVKYLLDTCRSSLKHIYYACIRYWLEYGNVAWGNYSQHEAELIENIQIEAARFITALRRNISRQKLYIELGLDTLENRRNKHKFIPFYKIIKWNDNCILKPVSSPFLDKPLTLWWIKITLFTRY